MEQHAVQIPHPSVSKASVLKLVVTSRLAPIRSSTSVVFVMGMVLAAERYQAHIIKSCKTTNPMLYIVTAFVKLL